MPNKTFVTAIAAVWVMLVAVTAGQSVSAEMQLVNCAAAALGGKNRLMAVKTLQIVGYGELAYFNGGGNITGHSDAPQKMNNIEYRNIKVETNLALHAQRPFPIAEVVSAIEAQVRNAQAFCRKASNAQFYQPGCPIQYNRPLPSGAN